MFTLVLIGVATLLFFVYFKVKFSYWEKRGLPGPKPIPFLGTLLAESSSDPRELELKFYNDYGPVFGTYMGTQPILNISNVEYMKAILSDLEKFPLLGAIDFNDRYLTHSMLFKNGPDWRQARAAQTHYFTSKKFRNLLGHFDKVAFNFLNNLKSIRKETKSDDVEVKDLSKYYSIDIIAKVLFAIDIDSFKERETSFVQNAMQMGNFNQFQGLLLTILPTKISKFLQLNMFDFMKINSLGDYFKKTLKERRASGIKYNDLSELLQDFVDDNKAKLTEEEVIGNILLSFFAGVEPVANTIIQMFYYLSEYPEVQRKLYDEISSEFGDQIDYEKLTQAPYLDAVLNESLRISNNNLLIIRTAVQDAKIGDLKIEKGTEMRLIPVIAHLSPDHYVDPKRFNPDRFLKGSNLRKDGSLFIPFSTGLKNCLGQRLAIIQTKHLIVRVLQKYVIAKATDIGLKAQTFRGFIITNKLNIRFKER